jgi:cytochrome c-type biogenesis protein
MGIESQLPTALTVIVTAAIDSINPCAIGVLVLMLSVIMAAGQSIKRMVFLGSVYIFGVFSVYLVAGLGFVYLFSNIPLYVTEYLSIGVAVLIIIAAFIEIKDYYWYGEGFSLMIPPIFAKRLHNFASNTTVWGVLFLGAFVSAVELPCTGAPYLAIITILSQYFDFTAFMLLVLYNLIFVSTLIVILIMVAGGKKLQDIKAWKQDNRGNMRLYAGLLLIALAWMLILISNGTINFG